MFLHTILSIILISGSSLLSLSKFDQANAQVSIPIKLKSGSTFNLTEDSANKVWICSRAVGNTDRFYEGSAYSLGSTANYLLTNVIREKERFTFVGKALLFPEISYFETAFIALTKLYEPQDRKLKLWAAKPQRIDNVGTDPAHARDGNGVIVKDILSPVCFTLVEKPNRETKTLMVSTAKLEEGLVPVPALVPLPPQLDF